MAADSIDELITASRLRIQNIENVFWSSVPDESLLNQYHSEFQKLEQLITQKGNDQRHEFVIIVPVADRPQHLDSRMQSLLQPCQAFAYGGVSEKKYQKVSVIIADDSKEDENIIKHKAIAANCNKQGLATLYFGLEEQRDQIDLMSQEIKQKLSGVLGDTDKAAFYHKGASIMRNITYLELNKIASVTGKVLFYFIDSDQEFRLKISTSSGDKNVYACNFLYQLDQIFTHTSASILTGKVVGDPPVSPAVMAENFLEDVIGFLEQMATCDPELPCQLHHSARPENNEAAYHDMASLFVLKPVKRLFNIDVALKVSIIMPVA